MAAAAQSGMPFEVVVALLEPLGFRLDGVQGSHRIYRHPEVPRPIALEPEDGQAKASEIGELLDILDRYDLPGTRERASTLSQTIAG